MRGYGHTKWIRTLAVDKKLCKTYKGVSQVVDTLVKLLIAWQFWKPLMPIVLDEVINRFNFKLPLSYPKEVNSHTLLQYFCFAKVALCAPGLLAGTSSVNLGRKLLLKR